MAANRSIERPSNSRLPLMSRKQERACHCVLPRLISILSADDRFGPKKNCSSINMDRFTTTAGLLLLIVPLAPAGTPATPAQADSTAPRQDPPASFYSKNTPKDLVEFEMMTWPEVYRAIHHEGKTTALFYTGGTESRGPQNVNGGDKIMAEALVKAIAPEPGNARAVPALPSPPNQARPPV